MEQAEIAIVGAGIGGLTLALALQRSGRRVTVFEKTTTLREVGAGVMLAPNATRVLHGLGLADGLARVGYIPAFSEVRDGTTGEVLSHTPSENGGRHADGSPFYYLHRADLHALLLGSIVANDADCLRLGYGLSALHEDGNGVTARFGHAPDVRCDALVGADGVKSTVRSFVNSGASARFTGNVAWRGLVPIGRIRPGIAACESVIWVGKARHVVRYAVRGGTLMNYVAIAERSVWTDEGWTVPSTVAEVLAEFDDWHPDILDIMAATPSDACFQWGLFDHEPLPRWSTGRVTLLGDAAHPMLPFMAQGAAMSIEDAATLSTLILTRADVGTALADYERIRLPRTSWVQAQSRRNQRLYHDGSTGREFDADRALRAARLYGYDARQIEAAS